MDNPQELRNLEFLWTCSPLDSEETIKGQPPLLVTLLGVVQEQPRYIRDVNLKVAVITQIVTTPNLTRGYIARAADDYLLCEISSEIENQAESQDATLTFVGIHKTIEDADAWIAEGRE